MPRKVFEHIENLSIPVTRDPDGGPLLVLLGLKAKRPDDALRKRKRIGVGFWINPGGGNQKRDISPKHSAQRELREEMSIEPTIGRFRRAGVLKSILASTNKGLRFVHFYVVHVDFNQKDFVVPEAGVFEKAEWFDADHLPEKMFADDKKWLPRILKGQKLSIIVPFKDETMTATLPAEITLVGMQSRIP